MVRSTGCGTNWRTAALRGAPLLVLAALFALLAPGDALAIITSSGNINVNEFLGAERFYDAGYTGTRTIQANIEAGHIWNGHRALEHVTTQVTGSGALGTEVAHATRVGSALAGRSHTDVYPNDTRAWGIAYGAETWSGAIATAFGSDNAFSLSHNSVATTYAPILQTGVAGQTADVFNSSWGSTSPSGDITMTRGIDGIINNTGVVGVFAAGNDGPDPNTVWDPAAGYNVIAVGALTYGSAATAFTAVANFSSRGPGDFDMATSPTIVNVIPGVRTVVDIVAPGQVLTVANRNAQSSVNAYINNQAGTSLAAPLVAGGASLLVDAGKDLYAGNANAIDGRVVKAVLLNSADKLAGWNNGQTNLSGVIHTTQSLDWKQGAGRMNLDRAFDQYVATAATGSAGTTDFAGLGGGDVKAVGWDFGRVDALGTNTYFIDQKLVAGTALTATLSWFADRNTGSLVNFVGASEEHLANLDLTIFRFDDLVNRNIIGTVAESVSMYNLVEHLSFLTPETGYYGINVNHSGDLWNFTGQTNESFGLAWAGSALLPGDRFWINAAGGLFVTDNNWDPAQSPGDGDTAIFNLPNTYTVEFTSDENHERLRVINGQVTFDFAGQTYSLVETSVSNASVTVDATAGGSAFLLVSGGTLAGVNGSIAASVGAQATVNVNGVGSQWQNSAALFVGGGDAGAGGEGDLVVDNGGSVSIGNTLTVWSAGSVTVGTDANAATLNAGHVTIDGGEFERGYNGAFALDGGGSMTIENAGHATFHGNYTTAADANYSVTGSNSLLETLDGSLTIASGAALHVQAAGDVATGGSLDIADGELVVDGPGSTATISSGGNSTWGYDGGSVSVTFSNSAMGVITWGLNLAQDSGTDVLVNVESNADLVIDALTLGEPGTDSATDSAATLNVDGFGSSLTVGNFEVGDNSTNTFEINVGVNAAGAVFVAGPAASTVHSSGSVTIGSATSTGTFISDGDLLVDGGSLVVENGSGIEFAGGKLLTLTNDGKLGGSGIVVGNVENTSGDVAPGSTSNALAISGDYLQGANASLVLDIAGTTPASDFDQLVVGGLATLDGTLSVVLDSFLPAIGDTFEVLIATGGVVGTFLDPDLPELDGELDWHVEYSATSVLLAAVLSGDYNGDNVVDMLDYAVWRNNLGGLTELAIHYGGDGLNGIDEADFNLWKLNYGRAYVSPGGGGLARAATQVPEPATIWFAVLLFGYVAALRRSR